MARWRGAGYGAFEAHDVLVEVSLAAGRLAAPRERTELLALRPDILGTGADQPGHVVLLEDMRAPSGDAAHGEHRGEELGRNAQRVEQGREIEVHVGILPRHRADALLDRAREAEPVAAAGHLARRCR